MVILTFHYLNEVGDLRWHDSQPMLVDDAVQRVMRFCQSGVDVICYHDSGTMDVLLMHRVTGIKIVPANPQ